MNELPRKDRKMPNQDLVNAVQEIKSMTADSLLMCAPRRHSLGPLVILRQQMLGALYDPIRQACLDGLSSEQCMEQMLENPVFSRKMDEQGLHENMFVFNYVIMRHVTTNAPIFTVSPALDLMLEDTKINGNIPVRFFAPPAATCFIEFDPPENRQVSTHRSFAERRYRICEGAFVQENIFPSLPKLSRMATEMLELDPNLPTRKLNISFSASPVDKFGKAAGRSMAGEIGDDTVDFLSLFLQDPEEDVTSMLERHIRYYLLRNEIEASMSALDFDAFTANFRRNLIHLTKIFFYLNVEKRQQVKINAASDLERSIKAVAPKKQRKLIQQRSRVYDRIVVGPKEYVPVSQRLEAGDLPSGTRRPHYRRGYFGIRYVGSGQAKHAELVRVKEALINEQLIKDADIKPKQYEVR